MTLVKVKWLGQGVEARRVPPKCKPPEWTDFGLIGSRYVCVMLVQISVFKCVHISVIVQMQ